MRCLNQCDYPGRNGEPCRCEQDAATHYQNDVSMRDYIRMPRELTAENGAKALLIGEFHVEYEEVVTDEELHHNPELGETRTVKIPVPWSTIKAIYRMAAERLSR